MPSIVYRFAGVVCCVLLALAVPEQFPAPLVALVCALLICMWSWAWRDDHAV